MTKRSFIKMALSSPIAALASDIIPEKKYGFNFIGDRPHKPAKTLIRLYKDDMSLYIFCLGQYQKDGVSLQSKVIQYPTRYDEDHNKPDMLEYSLDRIPMLFDINDNNFVFLQNVNQWPIASFEAINRRLINDEKKVDVFTDIKSFKTMLDTKYDGLYTKEFLNDVANKHFTYFG